MTALAAKREFSVYIDETAELFDVISISAGVRGTQILLAPADYMKAVSATANDRESRSGVLNDARQLWSVATH